MKLIRPIARLIVAFIVPALIFSVIIGFLPAGKAFSFLTAPALSEEITAAGPEQDAATGQPDAADPDPVETSGQAADTAVLSTAGKIFVDKDETVYASLDNSGVIRSLTVVNLMRSKQAGGMVEFVDYAIYKKVVPLSENIEPSILAGKVVFKLPKAAETFYYRGDPENREIPFLFDIAFSLDGVKTDSVDMAGKSGKIAINLSVKPNPGSEKFYLDNYMCQIQIPLSLNIFSNIASTGGQAVIAGSSATYSFTVLPGKSGTFEITADATLFETTSASIVCIPFSLTELAGPDFNISPDDFKSLLDGADRLVDGAKELGTGIGKLCDTLNLLSGSASELASGQADFSDGFSQFQNGIESLSDGIGLFSQGLSSTAAGGTELNAGFGTLHDNLSLFLSQLTPLTAVLPADQQSAFQYQVAAIEGGLDAFSDSLSQYIDAVNAMAQASAEINTGMQASVAGGQSLGSGLDSLAEGANSFAAGMDRLSSGATKLKNGSKKAVDGQSALAAGLRSSLGLFDVLILPSDASQPVSFVNPEVVVRSVQFVVNTPEIRMASAEPTPEQPEPEKNIWQKFLALFDGIFKK